jgi:hypothetical protein
VRGRFSRPLLALAAAGAAGAALAACGGPQQINPKGEEAFFKQALPQAYPALAGHIKRISCPSGFPPEKGQPYKCKVTATDGSTAHVVGVQLDDQGHLGSIRLVK